MACQYCHPKGFLDLQLVCVQARVEEVGQALLRRTQDARWVGPRRKGKRSRFHMDAYEHMLPDVNTCCAACSL